MGKPAAATLTMPAWPHQHLRVTGFLETERQVPSLEQGYGSGKSHLKGSCFRRRPSDDRQYWKVEETAILAGDGGIAHIGQEM